MFQVQIGRKMDYWIGQFKMTLDDIIFPVNIILQQNAQFECNLTLSLYLLTKF